MNDSMAFVLFSMEKVIDNKRMTHWMRNNWHLSIFFVVCYLVSIFLIRQFMKIRSPFRLNGIFFWWNLALAIFSISGSIRVLPVFAFNLTLNGIFGFTCHYPDFHQIFVFWVWLFVFSKVLELGDTIFVLFRKKNLLFLHYYHHSVTLIVTWILAKEPNSLSLWYASVNFLVHAFMYTYFALCLLKWKIPRIVAMLITSLQFIQMLVGLSLTALIIIAKYRQYNCQTPSSQVMTATLVMYLTYVVLFGKFFLDKYLSKDKRIVV